MQYLRRIGLSLAGITLTVSLLGFAITGVLSNTVRDKEQIKSWLKESGIYDEMGNSIVNQMKKDSQSRLPDKVNTESPEAQAALNKAFNPEMLKGISEKLVDGVFTWLDSDSDSPNVNIDLTEAKTQLADNLSIYAIERINNLPACTPLQLGSMSAGSDPLTISCKPPSVNTDLIKQQVKGEVSKNLAFIPTNYNAGKATEGQNWPEQIKSTYKITAWLPYVFCFLIVISVCVLIFLSSTKKNGAYRASAVFGLSGLGLIIFSVILLKAPKLLMSSSNKDAGADIAKRLIEITSGDTGKLLIWYGVGYLIISIAGILIAKFLLQKMLVSPTSTSFKNSQQN